MSEIKLPEPKYFTTKNGRLWTYKDEVDQTGLAIAVFTADQMKAAILEERERCAKICEDGVRGWSDDRDEAMEDCAAAIRKQ